MEIEEGGEMERGGGGMERQRERCLYGVSP